MKFCYKVLFGVAIAAICSFAQQNGRFASLKSQALVYFDRGQYDQVAGKLEEIWEQDQSDPKVAEYLAMGYLYGEHNLTKAKPVFKGALEHGGQATFLVQHSHEKGGFIMGDTMSNYCAGKLSVSPGKLSFIADSGDHSVSLTSVELKEFKVLGGSPGRIQVKSANKTWTFRVKTEKYDEAAFAEELVTQNLKK